jgi:UDP-3-O-[3-hydroxymyristoyl] glucosamine N-acyltransferase
LALSLGELATRHGYELVGDPSVAVTGVATLSNAGEGQLCFFANAAYRNELKSTRAAAVVLRPADVEDCPVAALLAPDPYLAYARIAADLYPLPAGPTGVHPTAHVADGATIGNDVSVSANAVIEADARLGNGVFIGPGVVIGPGCRVGDGTRILANATLVEDVVIGDRCIIHPGAVIGSDGFGNALSENGWVKVPQVGRLRIGNDVEIGANASIDRGAIDDTVIEDGVRIDNLVHIAHNVRVGAHTAIAAQTGIAGSTDIGQRCMFGGQAGIVGHISICDDVIVSGKTVVSKDVTEPGFYTGVFPGEQDRLWKRKVAHFRRLGDLVKRVSALEKSARKGGE